MIRAAIACAEGHAGPSRLTSLIYVPRTPIYRALHTSESLKSGHNRWSKIRHRKGAADAQKSALYTRFTADIHAALRSPGSTDPNSNTKLATALAKAREGGVPKDVVEKCFAKARAASGGAGQSVIYEAVGASGIEAMIIECITENPARTVKRVKEILHKRNCRIAPVAYLFDKKGVILVSIGPRASYDDLYEVVLEGGAEDVRETEDENGTLYEIITPATELGNLTSLLSEPPHDDKYHIQSSEINFIPSSPLPVLSPGEEGEGISEEMAEAVDKVIEMLEVDGDVVKIWTNLDWTP